MAVAVDKETGDVLSFALAGLKRAGESGGPPASLLARFKASLEHPHEQDEALIDLARQFSITLVEILCVRLTMAAEEDVAIGHAIAQLQSPLTTHRPTVGLLAHCFGDTLGARAVQVIGHGEAVRSGILHLSADDVPLAERQVSVPLPTSLALQGVLATWPGTQRLRAGMEVPLGRATDRVLERFATQLSRGDAPQVLVIRASEPIEARAAAEQLCAYVQSPPILIETENLGDIAPWLFVHRAVPVFQLQLAPGDRRQAPHVPNFPGPTVVITGTDGEFENEGRRVTEWRIPIPDRDERFELWQAHVPAALARTLADEHRHSAVRIAMLGRELAPVSGQADITPAHVRDAARRTVSGVGAMAELVDDDVPESALVVTPDIQRDLDDLVRRCRMRDGLVDDFGPALRSRYRPAVRALFVGPSGTGKTLAAGWVAARLGLPLFRVDLSAVTSKYIGDTEKNISQLLSRAEDNEMVLLFDEADSMFGKRTEVRDAHDRFANAQTNFLLQRLESYDGIVLLTSNSRARFDQAFARRLDLVIEFPAPGPEERRALWLAHLGTHHALSPARVNAVAAAAELSGGQIRAAVLSAAIHAGRYGRTVEWDDVIAGLDVEFRKMGRQLPAL